MKRDACITEMEALHLRATNEGRVFSDEEAARFAELRVMATAARENPVEKVIEQPAGTLRPVAGSARTLSAAVMADGLATRLHANGKARVDVPVNIRALGTDQAVSPAPGIAVQPRDLGVSSGYVPLYGRLLDYMASLPVDGNAIVYTRLSYATGGGGGNKAAKVQELAVKPESILATAQVTQTIDTWAHWLPASKQVLDDVSGLRALLDTTLVEGLKDKIDAGIFAAMTSAGHFTAYAAVANDNLGDAIARIATTLAVGGATGIKIGVNPATLLAMSIAKASGAGTYLGLPPNIPGSIVPAASVPAGNLLAWSDGGAVWANREGVSVVAGLNADDFTHNRISLLCEARGSVLTLNPNLVLYGTALAA